MSTISTKFVCKSQCNEDMDTDMHPPHSTKPDDVRRERKRAHDRRAQRVARERTKNRIAELEATVNALRQQESDDRSASLTEQLNAVTVERDELAAVLSNVEAALRKYTEQFGRKSKEVTQGEEIVSKSRDPDILQTQRQVPLDGWPGISALESNMQGLADEPGSDRSELYEGSVGTAAIHGENLLGLRIDGASPTSVDIWSGTMLDLPSTIFQTHDSILPQPETPCECSPHSSITTTSGGHGNIWRSANAILSEPHDLSVAVMHYEDTTSDDIAVRVILEGWNAVERSIQLPPIWRKLRRIDELQFSHCADTERLAVLSTMHLMLRCYADPTPERWSKLPPWMQKRPCQTAITHSYAIDFFVWPGLRERFVFSQHRYCSNSFWKYFTANLLIVWPYEFRDCYKRDLETGNISISTEFKARMADLNAWTMCPDFFQQYPDLYADIPASRSIPKQLYANIPAGRVFSTHLYYEQEQGGKRTAHLTNRRAAEQSNSCREYSDKNWVEGLSQYRSDSKDTAFEENLQLCLL